MLSLPLVLPPRPCPPLSLALCYGEVQEGGRIAESPMCGCTKSQWFISNNSVAISRASTVWVQGDQQPWLFKRMLAWQRERSKKLDGTQSDRIHRSWNKMGMQSMAEGNAVGQREMIQRLISGTAQCCSSALTRRRLRSWRTFPCFIIPTFSADETFIRTGVNSSMN